MKRCRKCLLHKPLTDFYAQADTADGATNYCKKCLSATRRANEKKDREANRKRNERRKLRHRMEQRRDYQRLYRWRKRKAG